MKGIRRSAGIAPHVLDGVSDHRHSPTTLSLGEEVQGGGSESEFGLFEGEKNLLHHQRIKPDFLDGLAHIGKCRHIQFLLCFVLTSCPSSPPSPHHAFASTNHLSSEQPKLVKRMTRKHGNYSTDKLHALVVLSFVFPVFLHSVWFSVLSKTLKFTYHPNIFSTPLVVRVT